MLPECCLNINLTYLGLPYALDLTPVYSESGELLYYSFDINYGEGQTLSIHLVWSDGVWELIDGDDGTQYYSFESDLCPIGQDEQWTNEYGEGTIFDSFLIYWDGCPNALPICCMYINIQLNGIWYHLPVGPRYNNDGGLIYYSFTINYETEGGPAEMNVSLGYANGVWYMMNIDSNVIYYTLESDTCPSSIMSDWQYQLDTETVFNDFEILNVDCHQTVPECCLSISTIYDGETYTADLAPVYDEGNVLLYYEFVSFEPFRLYYYDGVWYIVEGSILHYSLDLAGCPGSVNTEWQEYTPFFDAFVVFSLDCENEPDEQEFIDIPEKPDLYYCKHKNLMRKVRAGLADRVADMKDVERFGLDKCMDKWEDIIKDYLIVHALQCAPYNEYTGLDEKCLIGKLTDKFNC